MTCSTVCSMKSDFFQPSSRRAAQGRITQTTNALVRGVGTLVTASLLTFGAAATASASEPGEPLRPVITRESKNPVVMHWSNFISGLDSADVGEDLLRAINAATDQVIEPLELVPRSALTPDGSYLMEWDLSPHHFELELRPDGTYDWFYRNAETGKLDGDEGLLIDDGFHVFKRRLKKKFSA